MKSFKFVKVCLLALGVCSFAFAGVKAGDPPPPWVNKYNHSYWNALSTSTQEELIKLRGMLTLPEKYYQRGRTSSLFAKDLKYLHDFVKRSPDGDKKSLNHVIGFYSVSPDNEDEIWIDNSQLRKIFGKGKAIINRTFEHLSYASTVSKKIDFFRRRLLHSKEQRGYTNPINEKGEQA